MDDRERAREAFEKDVVSCFGAVREIVDVASTELTVPGWFALTATLPTGLAIHGYAAGDGRTMIHRRQNLHPLVDVMIVGRDPTPELARNVADRVVWICSSHEYSLLEEPPESLRDDPLASWVAPPSIEVIDGESVVFTMYMRGRDYYADDPSAYIIVQYRLHSAGHYNPGLHVMQLWPKRSEDDDDDE